MKQKHGCLATTSFYNTLGRVLKDFLCVGRLGFSGDLLTSQDTYHTFGSGHLFSKPISVRDLASSQVTITRVLLVWLEATPMNLQ